MSNQTKYLLTVDSMTGAAVRLEQLGDAGDLREVPLSMLGGFQPADVTPAQAPAQPMVVNIYLGGAVQGGVSVQPAPTAQFGLTGPGATARPNGPGGPGATLSGPGGPGATLSGPGGPGATLAGPGGPGATLSGPGGPGATLSGPGGPGASFAGPKGPGAGLTQ